MERFTDLNHYLKGAWNFLFRATVERNNPFRNASIASIEDGVPQNRIVVLREVNPQQRTLIYWTDKRSDKVAQLRSNPSLSALFWNEKRKLQIRASGTTTLLQNNDLTREAWDKIGIRGRKSYATSQAPGTTIEQDSDGLPAQWGDDLDLQDTEYAYDNFMIILQEVTSMECLHLHQEGHQRARFDWNGEAWQSSWLVP